MIELIFVIVIIGILAAVAIPKLAATRDDAKISNIIANARTGLGDMTSFYTSQGATVWGDANTTLPLVTNVPFKAACANTSPSTAKISGTAFLLCDETGGTACITFTTTATNISITTATGTTICDAVAADPAILAMTQKPQKLGGVGVVR